MSHIFLSYSREDKNEMQKLKHDLAAKGFTIWTDKEKLKPGTPVWQQKIETAIEEASTLIVLLSPEAKTSVWVRRELGYAQGLAIPIIPILLRAYPKNPAARKEMRAQAK